jgi:hypothetical protein
LVNQVISVFIVFKSKLFIQTKSIVFFNNFNDFSKAGLVHIKTFDICSILFIYQYFLKLFMKLANSRVFSKLKLVFLDNDSSNLTLFQIIFWYTKYDNVQFGKSINSSLSS